MDCRVRITTFAVFSGGTDEIGDRFRWQSFPEAIYLPPFVAGLLRESVQHRYTQYCNVVRERLLIDQSKQSVNIQDLDSGGRGRKFKSSHPDQYQIRKIGSLTGRREPKYLFLNNAQYSASLVSCGLERLLHFLAGL